MRLTIEGEKITFAHWNAFFLGMSDSILTDHEFIHRFYLMWKMLPDYPTDLEQTDRIKKQTEDYIEFIHNFEQCEHSLHRKRAMVLKLQVVFVFFCVNNIVNMETRK